MKKISTQSIIITVFVIAFLCVAFFVLANYLNMRQTQKQSVRVKESLGMLKLAENILTHVNELETNQHGYTLDSKEEFFKPYQNSIIALEADTALLFKIAQQKPERNNLVQQLNRLIQSRIENSNQTTTAFDNDGVLPLKEIIKLAAEKKISDSLKTIIQYQLDFEKKILSASVNSFETEAQRITRWFFILAAVFLLILISVFFIISNDLKEKRIVATQLDYQASLIDTISDAIFTTDEKFIIKSWNKFAANLYGFTTAEATGQHFSALLDVQLNKDEQEDVFQTLQKKGYYQSELPVTKKNGQHIFVLTSISTIQNNQHEITGYVAVHRDITERKLLEDQLKEFNQQLEEKVDLKTAELSGIFERITDGFIALDSNWCFTYINNRVAQILGQPSEAFIGKNIWTDFLETHNSNLFCETYKGAMANQQYCHYELYYPPLNMWIEHFIYPSPSGLSIYLRDVTHQKGIEEQILKARIFSDKIIDSLPGIFYIYDPEENRVMRWNNRAESITGYSSEAIVGVNFIEFIAYADRQMIAEKIKEAFELGQLEVEAKILNKHGQEVLFYFTAMVIEIDGKPFLIGNGIDISARKNAEEKLKKNFMQIQLLAKLSERVSHAEKPEEIYELALDAFINIVNAKKAAVSLFNEKNEMQLVASKYLSEEFQERFQEFCDWKKEERFTKSIYISDLDKDASILKILASCKNAGVVAICFIPLIYQSNLLGKFSLFFTEPHIFSEEEIQLIETIARDVAFAISEKKSQLALISSRQKYKLLFDYNPMPMWMLSYPERNFIEVNKAALVHYGYSREEFLQMNVIDIRPTMDKYLFEKLLDELNIGNDYKGVWRHKKKNGDIIKVEIIAHDIMYEGNNVRLILANDINEKIKAEEKLQQSYKQIKQLATHLQNIREQERTNIAREIHDELGQQLTGLKMYISWLSKKIISQEPEIKTKFTNTIELIEDTIKTVRKISTELRPSMLDDLGLLAAMEWQSTEFEKRSGIPIEFINLTNNHAIPSKYTTGLFRIFQESLTNVARHADAKKIVSSLSIANKQLVLTIQDDGKGFVLHNIGSKKTLGLFGMKERTMEMGGSYEIKSEPGRGTTVSIQIPIH